MWNVRLEVILVIMWETGKISESLRKYLSNILGKHVIKEVQKTAILGTAHKLQEVLM
jgi:protein required for attachment to host cells